MNQIQTSPQIPVNYVRLRSFCELKRVSRRVMMDLIRRGYVPRAIYSRQTRHYHLPKDLRIHLN